MYKEFGISKELEDLAIRSEQSLKPQFEKIEKIALENSSKVLLAFQKNKVSDMHFGTSTGYGEGDVGRDTIEKIFAEVLGAEDALVRNQFISGTHALTVSLFGLLRPGDTMLAISDKPYDTLDEVIGIRENRKFTKSFWNKL
jgi:cystathionine beta-lyase family protein involved in aluminum resistance